MLISNHLIIIAQILEFKKKMVHYLKYWQIVLKNEAFLPALLDFPD